MHLDLKASFILVSYLISSIRADDVLYSDGALSSTWQDWSWSSTINYAATDLAEGTSSISVNSSAWAALSFKDNTNFQGYQGLQFDIAVSVFIYNLRNVFLKYLLGRQSGCICVYLLHC